MRKKILPKVNSPADLKKLSYEELEILAAEVREELVEVVSNTGGHLAPNLGVVELTIGLHRSLDSPKDKIVWDVGHQCYVHKLFTGRRDQFATLRQYGGIAGFPKTAESDHDIFDTGHASTSISFALGLAEARSRKKRKEHIVALIGDGSLTGGMAYEALNQVGHLGTRLIIILNDNEMSIASNVGAMSSYLNRIRLDPLYLRVRDEIERRVKKIPAIGEKMYSIGESVKGALKYLLGEGVIFEELGINYIGPIDGHNIKMIEETMAVAKTSTKPVIIHALTKKGKGYAPAESSPEKFHGTAPFIIKTGKAKVKNGKPSYTEVFGRTMIDLAKKNKKIVALTAAMASGTGLSKFKETFPDRFYDVGIAEQHAVTFAAGLARGGYIPVVAIYSTFLERAYDQIVQDVCLQGLHVVFMLDRAGLVGEDGPTHHGVFDLSYLRHIPNLIVMAPKNEEELRHMLFTATKRKQPVAIRYPRGAGQGVELTSHFEQLNVGEAEIIKEGSDVCLFAVGKMVDVSTTVAQRLEEKGISVTLINGRFIKPLDKRTLKEAGRSHKLLVTLEENALIGGLGSAVSELFSDERISIPVTRIGLPDRFVTHGETKQLLKDLELDADSIVQTIKQNLPDLDIDAEIVESKSPTWIHRGLGI